MTLIGSEPSNTCTEELPTGSKWSQGRIKMVSREASMAVTIIAPSLPFSQCCGWPVNQQNHQPYHALGKIWCSIIIKKVLRLKSRVHCAKCLKGFSCWPMIRSQSCTHLLPLDFLEVLSTHKLHSKMFTPRGYPTIMCTHFKIW